MDAQAYAEQRSMFAVMGLVAAIVAASMVAGAGPAYRFQLATLGTAFSLLRWGAWLGLGATLVALIAAWSVRPNPGRRNVAIATAGAVIGLLAFGIPFAMLQNAKRAPPIHDITTDTADPPRFVAVVPLRRGAPNSVDYAGEAIAAQQRAAYPDVQPAILPVPPERAYERALAIARRMGWAIDAAAPAEGRIEATDTTSWFGFQDDIVVRVTPAAGGSRIDVRSVSRLGQSDLGKNARRVRAYLHELRS